MAADAVSKWETIEVVPVVKAYPATRSNGSEAVCVAGVRLGVLTPPTWIRLFPVPFRSLTSEKQFRKWEPITLHAQTHSSDRRPETMRPNVESIKAAGKIIKGPQRTAILDELGETTTCRMQAEHANGGATLGWVRPEVLDFEITPRPPDDVKAAQRRADAAAAQETLFGPQKASLEAIPFTFHYRYRCAEPGCSGNHRQSNIDWELHQTFRRWRHEYPADYVDRLRVKWLDEMCGPDKDTRFYLGNMHQHPGSFLVLGVSWLRRG